MQWGCLSIASLPPVQPKKFREVVIATKIVVTEDNVNVFKPYILHLAMRAELYGTREDRSNMNRLVAMVRKKRS